MEVRGCMDVSGYTKLVGAQRSAGAQANLAGCDYRCTLCVWVLEDAPPCPLVGSSPENPPPRPVVVRVDTTKIRLADTLPSVGEILLTI